MKKYCIGATVLMLSAVESGLAKEHLIVKEDEAHLAHRRPVVDEYPCGTCLIENESSRLCLTYGGDWTVGWQWAQEWYDDPSTVGVKDGYYKLGIEFYSEQAGGATSLFDISRLWYNDLRAQMERFKAKFTVVAKYFHDSRRTCVESFTYVDDFYLQVEMSQKFPECWKDVIDCLWSTDNWTGAYAKYITCRMSDYEDIDIKTYEQENSSIVQDPEDVDGCFPGFNPLFSQENPNEFVGILMDRTASYMFNTLDGFRDNKDYDLQY